MKSTFLVTAAFLAVSTLFAADTSPKDEVVAAAKKLADQPNYSWKATVTVPESVQWRPGPTEGKTEKDGYTCVTYTFGDNMTEVVKKDGKAAITDQDGAWQLASEMENAEGPGRFMARMAANLRTPTMEVQDLLAVTKDLKKDGEVYSAELTEEGARRQFRFGQPQNPKGSVKFWLKEGMLAKFEVKLEAKMEFNGNEFDASRTTTTEIQQIGATKVTVPAEAKKKLS